MHITQHEYMSYSNKVERQLKEEKAKERICVNLALGYACSLERVRIYEPIKFVIYRGETRLPINS